MESNPSVCIIIATWNSRDLLEQCIGSLKKNTEYPNWSLWIVDNASTDGTSSFVRGRWPEANLLCLEENEGLVPSFNRIVSQVDADYYIRLDTDAFVQQGWLAPLVEAIESSEKIGFASSLFFYPDNSIHYAGACLSATLGVEVVGHGEKDSSSFVETTVTPFAHGMCLIRREVINEVGLLDERFAPGYYEEFEYQFRALRRGFQAVFVPLSTIIHVTGGTFAKQPSDRKTQIMERNWLQLLLLHWPTAWLALRVPFEGLRILRAILSGAKMAPYLNAWRAILENLRYLRQRRAEIKKWQTVRLNVRRLLRQPMRFA